MKFFILLSLFLAIQARRNRYEDLAADYSVINAVPTDVQAKMIKLSEKFISMKADKNPELTPELYGKYERENKEFWPTHCEALRQRRGDLLTAEYRSDLIYMCADGFYNGTTEQQEREKHWWAIIAQDGVQMTWPLVYFYGEVIYFEWNSIDLTTFEVIARGSVTFLRRGHAGAVYLKTEQLTFFRDVYASQELLDKVKTK